MRRWTDVGVSAALVASGQLEVWWTGAAGGGWPAALTTAGAALVLLGRRRAPVATAVGVVVCQALCGLWATPDAVTFGVISVLAWYAVGRWAKPRQAHVALAAMCLVAIGMITPRDTPVDWVNQYLSVALTGFVVPWLVGFVVRLRSDAADRRDAHEVLQHPAPAPAPDVPPKTGPDVSSLSPREVEVFGLLARGATNTEIAEELVLSIYTVKAHVASILAKLGLRDRVQVVVYAHQPEAIQRPRLGTQGPP
jgi:DNA-binding NarL/FixJ family response regulator